jgi:hypothetical protein
VRIRAERSAPVIDRFHRWLEGLAPQVVPQSRLGRAVHYTLGQWPKLTVFLNHGEVPLDKAMISYCTSLVDLSWAGSLSVH